MRMPTVLDRQAAHFHVHQRRAGLGSRCISLDFATLHRSLGRGLSSSTPFANLADVPRLEFWFPEAAAIHYCDPANATLRAT